MRQRGIHSKEASDTVIGNPILKERSLPTEKFFFFLLRLESEAVTLLILPRTPGHFQTEGIIIGDGADVGPHWRKRPLVPFILTGVRRPLPKVKLKFSALFAV